MTREDEFHLRLGRLTHAMSVFDFNLGLAIKRLGELNNQDVSQMLIGSKPFKIRLDEFKKFFEIFRGKYPARNHSKFVEWFEKVEEFRQLRNDFVHARWGVRYAPDVEHPGEDVEYTPIHWETDQSKLPPTKWLSFVKFDQYIEEINRLSISLRALSDEILGGG
jgi:hypothetical protein